MPPAENNTPEPTQSPAPAPKQSFWAKLFGKKSAAPEQPTRESQTPPPQLDDPSSADASGSLSDVSAPAPTTPTDVPVPPATPEAPVVPPAPAPAEEPKPTPPTTPPSTPAV